MVTCQVLEHNVNENNSHEELGYNNLATMHKPKSGSNPHFRSYFMEEKKIQLRAHH